MYTRQFYAATTVPTAGANLASSSPEVGGVTPLETVEIYALIKPGVAVATVPCDNLDLNSRGTDSPPALAASINPPGPTRIAVSTCIRQQKNTSR